MSLYKPQPQFFMNDVQLEDEKMINDLEHIYQYLLQFEPMVEENSNDSDIKNTSRQENQEVEYEEYEGSSFRSEIRQWSEMIEKRKSESSSFIMIYNNVHYLKEPVIFGTILDFYFKPSEQDYTSKRGDDSSFLKFLTLRQVCKSWKRFIDEKYGRQFILSVFQDRVKYQDCQPNVDFTLFSIPLGLTIMATFWPSFIAHDLQTSPPVSAACFGLSCYLSFMIVCGYPMLLPVGFIGSFIDLAIESMKEKRFYKRLENRYENMEQNILGELTYFDKCEIISTVQDEERYNSHSCYYIVEVTLNISGKTLGYQIKKKYTQFKSLYDSMCKCINNDVLEVNEEKIEFPTKRWILFSNTEQVIEERKLAFQKILNLIVNHQEVFHSTEIYSFFYDRKNQQALLGNTAIENGEEDGFLIIENE